MGIPATSVQCVLVVLARTISIASRSCRTSQWPISDVNFLANVILYSLIGFRVGRVTGVVREAAEAGVIAGVVVAAIGIAASLLIRTPAGAIDSANPVVGIVAQNVAIGGVLAILTGWIGSRSQQDRPPRRR